MNEAIKLILGSLLTLSVTAHSQGIITTSCNDNYGSSIKIIQLPEDGEEKNRPKSYKDVLIRLEGPAAQYFSKSSANVPYDIPALVDTALYDYYGLASTGGSRYSSVKKVIYEHTGVKFLSHTNGWDPNFGSNWYFGSCDNCSDGKCN